MIKNIDAAPEKRRRFAFFFDFHRNYNFRTNDYMENDGRFMFFNRTHSMYRNAVYIG